MSISSSSTPFGLAGRWIKAIKEQRAHAILNVNFVGGMPGEMLLSGTSAGEQLWKPKNVRIDFFKRQDEFSDWLEEHGNAREIWVGYYKKSTGRPSLTWSTSVDVALCYGWIDVIRNTIDEHSYKIRFTPRKIGSVWSAVNVEKAKALIQLGKMKPAGLHHFNNRIDAQGYSAEHRNVPLAREYVEQIKANLRAWTYFSNLAPSYKRDSIWWVMSAKKEETRLRRLGILISSSEAGLKIPALRKKE